MTPREMDILAGSKAQKDHLSRPARERVAKSIAATDEIRVYLLDPVFEPTGLEPFPMPEHYRWAKTGVHGQNTLVGEPMTRLRDLWSAILSEAEGWPAGCHYPIHGLRFLGGGSVLFETSLCWVCNNYYVVDGVTTVIGFDKVARVRGHAWLGLPGDRPYGPREPGNAGAGNSRSSSRASCLSPRIWCRRSGAGGRDKIVAIATWAAKRPPGRRRPRVYRDPSSFD